MLGIVVVQIVNALALMDPVVIPVAASYAVGNQERLPLGQDQFSVKPAALHPAKASESSPTRSMGTVPVGPYSSPVLMVVVQLKLALMPAIVTLDAGAVAVNAVPAAVPLLDHVDADAAEADVSAERISKNKVNALSGFLDIWGSCARGR